MSQPTPEQLREAARHLASAVAAEDSYNAYMQVAYAFDGWPDECENVQDGLSQLYIEREWRDNQLGMRWMAEAARWRLLITALVQEQQTRRVPVGHPDRNKKHEPCVTCGRVRRDCGCEQDEMMALVEQLMAPADALAG